VTPSFGILNSKDIIPLIGPDLSGEDILKHMRSPEQFNADEIPCLVKFHIYTRSDLGNLSLAFLRKIMS